MPRKNLLPRLAFLMWLGMAGLASAQQTAPPAPQQPPQPMDNQKEPSAAPGQPADSSTDDEGGFVLKKEVQEVVLHATVVDEHRRLATHLDKASFTVLQDGRQQTITSFHRDDVPVAIGILIDNSGSMRDKRDQVNQAVMNLIRASNPQDKVFVVNFTQNPYLDQDFTSDESLLEKALHQTSMGGSTALYDAVVSAAAHLKNNAPLDKRILLVITDGNDNMSRVTLQEAVRKLQDKSGPTLYAVGLMGLTAQHEGRDALQKLADATGGTAFFPDSLDQVSDITRSLAHDIRSQYTIAYKPQGGGSGAGAYHPIVVEARAPGLGKLTVRTRNGYYNGEMVR